MLMKKYNYLKKNTKMAKVKLRKVTIDNDKVYGWSIGRTKEHAKELRIWKDGQIAHREPFEGEMMPSIVASIITSKKL